MLRKLRFLMTDYNIKGLSNSRVFFHSQRVCGQQLPSWDKLLRTFDRCSTQDRGEEKCPKMPF